MDSLLLSKWLGVFFPQTKTFCHTTALQGSKPRNQHTDTVLLAICRFYSDPTHCRTDTLYSKRTSLIVRWFWLESLSFPFICDSSWVVLGISRHWYPCRVRARYLLECCSIWVCLMFPHVWILVSQTFYGNTTRVAFLNPGRALPTPGTACAHNGRASHTGTFYRKVLCIFRVRKENLWSTDCVTAVTVPDWEWPRVKSTGSVTADWPC